MKEEDFPSFFHSADELSKAQQKKFYIHFAGHLILLALATTLSFITPATILSSMVQAIIIAFVFYCSYILYSQRPDQQWYGARALAESLKTISWRYMTKAEPFHIDDCNEVFESKVKEMIQQNTEIKKNMLPKATPIISAEMKKFRNSEFLTRKDRYKLERIQDQFNWYTNKAKFNIKRSEIFFIILLSINAITLVLAITRIWNLDATFWITDFFIASACGILSWIQAKKYSELAASYNQTAHDISFSLNTIDRIKEEDFSKFIGDTENAFSREHTQWLARKDEN